MDLFEHENLNRNLLPYDGTVLYFGQIIQHQQSDLYFQELLSSVAWKNDEAVIYGKRIFTKRKVAWYGDHPYAYTYSKITRHALPWTPLLLELKETVQHITGETFNSCLLNLYHDGSEGMAWHSDGEVDLKKNGAIASLSLGAERKFAFKHRTSLDKLEFFLAHGSLLLMKDTTQKHWLHCLPPSKRVTTARINLTFRQIERFDGST